MSDLLRDNIARGIGAIVLAVLAAVAAHACLIRLLGHVPARTARGAGRMLIDRCRQPSRLVVATAVALLALPVLEAAEGLAGVLRHGLVLMLMGGSAWLLVQMAAAGADALALRFDVRAEDNLRARRVHTQAMIFRRVTAVAVGVVAVAVMLTTFPQVRTLGASTLGASMLASAGIAGIVARLRRPADALEPARRRPDRPDRADPPRRRGGDRGRVGPHRGDHLHRRGGVDLGRAAPDPPHLLFRHQPVPELDPYAVADPRERLPARGLLGADGGAALGARPHPAEHAPVGRPGGGAAGGRGP